MKEKIDAGRKVAERLFPAENTIDDAVKANASLVIATVDARRAFQAPCGLNQAVLAELMAAGNLLVEAREKTVKAHARIVRIRADEGLGQLPFGCDQPCLSIDEVAPARQLKVAS